MSSGEAGGQMRLDGIENAKLLLDRWTESLAQVLESMTDQKPEVRWQAVSGSLSEIAGGQEFLWWEQPFQIAAGACVWVAAPRATWEYAGTLTLKAAGLETVEISEAKNTWVEILGQSLAVLARSVGSLVGREVTTEAGTERAPDPDVREWASVWMNFTDVPATPPLLAVFSRRLLDLIIAPGASASDAPPTARAPEASIGSAAGPAPRSRTMDLLLDVDLQVSISFGKAQLPMKDVLKLTTGSIVELNRGLNEPVEVLVNHCLIARGEVVVVEGNYGVRLQEIASRQDRLRSLR